jgi:hypothetical protein
MRDNTRIQCDQEGSHLAEKQSDADVSFYYKTMSIFHEVRPLTNILKYWDVSKIQYFIKIQR